MGAAKDERGSVFCNTNQWEALWPLRRAGRYKRPLSGWVCSHASNTVLYCLKWKRSLVGLPGLQICSSACGRCSLISPLATSGTWQALKGSVTCVPPRREGNSAASVLLSSARVKREFGFERNLRKPIYVHRLTVAEPCGIGLLLQHCAFSAQSGLCTDLRASEGKPLVTSEAAGSCLPSPLFWHELVSVVLHCILLKSAFWSSVALNCAPPNMLEVWPDLQAKGVRQIQNRTLLKKMPF